jgi:hypothetical protein
LCLLTSLDNKKRALGGLEKAQALRSLLIPTSDSDYSSIVNTTVNGTTLSTSTRIGYRWFTHDSAWMLGVNGGYDTREMATRSADTRVIVTNSQTVDFQQVALGIEAVSDTWNVNFMHWFPLMTPNTD